MPHDLLPGVTGVLALADGTVLQGIGVGAVGAAVRLSPTSCSRSSRLVPTLPMWGKVKATIWAM